MENLRLKRREAAGILVKNDWEIARIPKVFFAIWLLFCAVCAGALIPGGRPAAGAAVLAVSVLLCAGGAMGRIGLCDAGTVLFLCLSGLEALDPSGDPVMLLWGTVFFAAMGISLPVRRSVIAGAIAAAEWSLAARALPGGIPLRAALTAGIVCLYLSVLLWQIRSVKARRSDQRRLQQYLDAAADEHQKMTAVMTQVLLSISEAVDARSPYTERHSSRVAEYATRLAKALGWSGERIERLYQIALLHDVGLIGVSDSVLNKQDRLTREEYEHVKSHTLIGQEILKVLTLMPMAGLGAATHHERFDGLGYPNGLKGEQIPVEARIIAIADAFDSMNSARVYRSRMTREQVKAELLRGRGTQFDPELLDRFMPIADELLRQETA